MNLLQHDGDPDARQHRVHHHRGDAQRGARHLITPNRICSAPAQMVITHVICQPKSSISPATTTVRPAAGPLT